MKAKLIQILLGAIGSAVTVLISHLASLPPEVAVGAALGAGPATTVAFANAAAHFLQG